MKFRVEKCSAIMLLKIEKCPFFHPGITENVILLLPLFHVLLRNWLAFNICGEFRSAQAEFLNYYYELPHFLRPNFIFVYYDNWSKSEAKHNNEVRREKNKGMNMRYEFSTLIFYIYKVLSKSPNFAHL